MFKINIFSTDDNEKILYIKDLNNFIRILSNNKFNDGIYDISEDNFLDIVKNNCASNEYIKFEKIIKNKNVNLKGYNIQFKYPHYSLCLHPSRNCNLACKYCYAHDENYLPNKELSIETAKDAINYIIYNIGKNASAYTIDLSGSGEPLLRFDFIKEIEDYCEEKRNETGKDIKIMFPTNGTLLDKEKAQYIDSKPNILLGVSIDGDECHNSNRIFKNKVETYKKVCDGINNLNGTFGLSVTITNNNENVDEIFDHLYKFKNVDSITMHMLRDFNNNSETCLYKINSKNLINHYKLLISNLEKHINQKDYNYLFTLLRGIDTLGNFITRVATKGKINKYRCGGGKNRFSIDDKGNLYTCAIVAGNKDFKVGDIYSGLDSERQKLFLKSNTDTSQKCKECWCAYICTGECPVVGYLSNGNIYEPDEFSCNIKKQLIKLSIEFVSKLQKNNYEAYKVLVNFANGKFNYSRADYGSWAILQYLTNKNINITYSDLCKSIGKDNKGVSPIILKNFINKYEPKFDAYSINDKNCFKDISYPAIVCSIHSDLYIYYIIEEVFDDIAVIKTLENNESIKVTINKIVASNPIIFTKL